MSQSEIIVVDAVLCELSEYLEYGAKVIEQAHRFPAKNCDEKSINDAITLTQICFFLDADLKNLTPE